MSLLCKLGGSGVMKRTDVGEEIRYIWDCPKCLEYNEECEDPNYEDSYVCEHCGHVEQLEDGDE